MSNTIYFKVEDITAKMLTYQSIRLKRATSLDGVYSLITTITLVALDYYYSYEDTSGGENSWYKYSFYHATGPVESNDSNPFQVQSRSRLKLRQFAIEEYDAGMVLEQSATAGSVTTIYSTDYRVRNTRSADSAKNGWTHPTSGSRVGETRNISANTPSTGLFTVTPAMTGALATADQFEWHWLVDPSTWNRCINRALRRYKYLERVPLVGDGNTEQSLAYLPWLTSRTQLCGLWYFPDASNPERAWSTNGQWWNARQEQGYLTLMTYPALETTNTVYMECLRPNMDMWSDGSTLPRDISIELAAALVYDEVLAWLLRPSSTAAESDKSSYKIMRNQHQSKLRNLWNEFGPRPRWQQPQLHQPSIVPAPWSAR